MFVKDKIQKLQTTVLSEFLAHEFKTVFSRTFKTVEELERKMKDQAIACPSCGSWHWKGCQPRCDCWYQKPENRTTHDTAF